MAETGEHGPRHPSKTRENRVVGEARWPMAFAVLAVSSMTLLLPHGLIVRPRWGVPLAERLLLVAVTSATRARSTGVEPAARLSITLIALLVATALWCTRSSSPS